jgi:hypothetical protein
MCMYVLCMYENVYKKSAHYLCTKNMCVCGKILKLGLTLYVHMYVCMYVYIHRGRIEMYVCMH